MVVVDVERERRAVQHLRVGPEAALVRTVDGHEHALAAVGRELAQQAVEREEAVLAGQRRRAGEVHDAVLAERLESEVHREQRPERVAVRVLVRRDEEAVTAADRGDHRGEVSCGRVLLGRGRLGRAHR